MTRPVNHYTTEKRGGAKQMREAYCCFRERSSSTTSGWSHSRSSS